MFDTLKRLILPTATLHCPRCEKSLADHDDAACARRMSRRFFFQVAAGAAVVVATPKIPTGGLFDPKINAASLYMDLDDFSLQFLKPAMDRLANALDQQMILEAGNDYRFMSGKALAHKRQEVAIKINTIPRFSLA